MSDHPCGNGESGSQPPNARPSEGPNPSRPGVSGIGTWTLAAVGAEREMLDEHSELLAVDYVRDATLIDDDNAAASIGLSARPEYGLRGNLHDAPR